MFSLHFIPDSALIFALPYWWCSRDLFLPPYPVAGIRTHASRACANFCGTL